MDQLAVQRPEPRRPKRLRNRMNYHDASDLAELEPTFRQVTITGQHFSSSGFVAEPEHADDP